MVNTFFALLLIVFVIYSKTSNNGPSEKRTTSAQWTARFSEVRNVLPCIELIHYEPPRSGHLSTDINQSPMYLSQYLRKRTVKLHPHNADAFRNAAVDGFKDRELY